MYRRLPRQLLFSVLAGATLVIGFRWIMRPPEVGDLSRDRHVVDSVAPLAQSALVWTKVPAPQPPSSRGQCELIHVAIVFDNCEEGRHVVLLLKSLLLSRRTPLALHFMTSPTGSLMISSLLSTWELPAVDYTIHTSALLQGASVVEQYFALLNSLENVLPTSIGKVIVLDPRMRLLTDMTELWQLMDSFPEASVMALASGYSTAERPSDFYFDVMAINLLSYGKSDIRRGVFSSNAKDWATLKRLFESQKQVIHNLPCEWMIRLQNGYDYSRCLKGINQVKAIWWSSDVYFTDAVLDPYIEKIQTWSTSDPNLLRHQTSTCYHSSKETQRPHLNPAETCNEFRYAAQLKKLTHYFFIGDFNTTGYRPGDITLTTVFTMSRFDVLLTLIRHWGGPMVAVLYGNALDVMRLEPSIRKARIDTKNIAFHVVYERGVHFPVNYLRNVAIRYCTTEYAFFDDVDLVPNVGAYGYLRDFLARQAEPHHAYVIPAFQAYEGTPLKSFPANKSEMVQLIADAVVSGYGMRRGWNLGHKPTDFNKWVSAAEPYPAVFKDAFEPYVVLPARKMPYYKEVLFNRMADKIGFALYLHHTGYEFIVVPEAFLVHLPHDRKDNSIWGHSHREYFRCGAVLITEFKKELNTKYPINESR